MRLGSYLNRLQVFVGQFIVVEYMAWDKYEYDELSMKILRRLEFSRTAYVSDIEFTKENDVQSCAKLRLELEVN